MYDFDQVQIASANQARLVDKTEWLKLPSARRVQQILSQKVKFLRGGKVVPARIALGSHRRQPSRRRKK